MTNKFPIGVTSLTNYLLVVARKVSNAGVEAERHSFGPAPTSINLVFTTLEPTNYYVDFRDSPDGTALGTLIDTFVFDAQSNQIISEKRYYTCGGPGASDPVDGAATIVDDYFTGKNVDAFFKEGKRYLKPGVEWTITRDSDGIVTGNTITVTDGTTFSTNEVITIEISYKDALPEAGSGGEFIGTILLSSNTTISATHYNKRLNNKATTATLVHTFPALSTIPDGTNFYFKSFGGTQIQTRLLLAGTDKIIWDGYDLTINELSEVSIGKGEWIWLQKNTDTDPYLEVIDNHPGITMVGEQLDADIQHPNTRMQDGTLYDGDEYPRPWWWINNKLPSSQCITDDTVINSDYFFLQDRIGLFVKHSTLKKFRLPKTMGLVKKGLADFTTFGEDITRPFDYPGGYQADSVGPVAVNILRGDAYTGSSEQGAGRVGGGQGTNPQTPVVVNAGGSETYVKNIGVIHLRRI